jgi:hypothetical protein
MNIVPGVSGLDLSKRLSGLIMPLFSRGKIYSTNFYQLELRNVGAATGTKVHVTPA